MMIDLNGDDCVPAADEIRGDIDKADLLLSHSTKIFHLIVWPWYIIPGDI